MRLALIAVLSLTMVAPVTAQPAPRAKPKVKAIPDLEYRPGWETPFKLDLDFDFPRKWDVEMPYLPDFDLPFDYEAFQFDALELTEKFKDFKWDVDRSFKVDVDVPFKVDVDVPVISDFRYMADADRLADKMGRRGDWSNGHRGGWLHRLPEGQGSPEDSVYRDARNVLSRYEYRRASELLGGFVSKYPKSRHTPAAMYWRAFALYRVGSTPDLEVALRVLDEQRQQYPDAAEDPDVSGLTARVLGVLAARGNGTARERLQRQTQQGVQSCDKEDMSVRAEALSALVQSDPASAAPVLRRALARRDECSAPLRRRAVYLLGRDGVGGTPEDLMEVAKNDPDGSVRSDALQRLGQMPGDGPVRQLEILLTSSTDERTQRAALNALRNSEHADAARILRAAVTREELADNVRADAIRSLARRKGGHSVVYAERPGQSRAYAHASLSPEDVTMLRGVYERSTSRVVRGAVLETIASSGGSAGDQWLTTIVRDQSQDLRYRSAALGRLRRSDVAIDELARLYDGLSERELRSEVIRILERREEPAATDKLIDIAKTGTDPVIRRNAIAALSRKNDPRTTKLLLELVEKP